MAPRKKAVTAVAGVEADLARLPADLRGSALAGSAFVLARELDSPATSATARAACARSLLGTLRELRSLAPRGEVKDELDELRARRARGG